MKVLILEDDPANLIYIDYLMHKLGFETVTATTAGDALKLLQDVYVDCMLIDIMLENGLTGIEFLNEISKNKRFDNVPKIAITAHTSTWLREEILKEGFDDFIGKPLKMKEVRKVLQRNLLIHIPL